MYCRRLRTRITARTTRSRTTAIHCSSAPLELRNAHSGLRSHRHSQNFRNYATSSLIYNWSGSYTYKVLFSRRQRGSQVQNATPRGNVWTLEALGVNSSPANVSVAPANLSATASTLPPHPLLAVALAQSPKHQLQLVLEDSCRPRGYESDARPLPSALASDQLSTYRVRHATPLHAVPCRLRLMYITWTRAHVPLLRISDIHEVEFVAIKYFWKRKATRAALFQLPLVVRRRSTLLRTLYSYSTVVHYIRTVLCSE